MRFRDRTALELVLAAAFGGGARRAIVVLGAHLSEARGAVPLRTDLEVVVNHQWREGQGSSLKAGLRALGAVSEPVLLFPVDYPLVRASTVAQLVERFEGEADCARGELGGSGRWFVGRVVPSANGIHGHPVLFSPELVPVLLALGPTDSARDVFRARPTVEVVVDDEGVVRDLDTEEDLELLRALDLARARAGE